MIANTGIYGVQRSLMIAADACLLPLMSGIQLLDPFVDDTSMYVVELLLGFQSQINHFSYKQKSNKSGLTANTF
jgi:hypothetical protein